MDRLYNETIKTLKKEEDTRWKIFHALQELMLLNEATYQKQSTNSV